MTKKHAPGVYFHCNSCEKCTRFSIFSDLHASKAIPIEIISAHGALAAHAPTLNYYSASGYNASPELKLNWDAHVSSALHKVLGVIDNHDKMGHILGTCSTCSTLGMIRVMKYSENSEDTKKSGSEGGLFDHLLDKIQPKKILLPPAIEKPITGRDAVIKWNEWYDKNFEELHWTEQSPNTLGRGPLGTVEGFFMALGLSPTAARDLVKARGINGIKPWNGQH